MFRKMRRSKQAVSTEECVKILKSETRGVLSVIGENGYPYGIPMDFYYDDGKIYFHGAKTGHKIDALKACDKVCFTVWNKGFKKPGDWAWTVTSVIAFGHARLVEDRELAYEKVYKMTVNFFPSEEESNEVIQKFFDNVQLIEMDIEHMTGKVVHEK